MNFSDIIALALRNLRQAKLRTALTVIGVVIGVAAIVTMVSFGLGLQENLLRDAFARIDLFTSITVSGQGAQALLMMQEEQNDSASDGTEESQNEKAPAATPVPSPTPWRVLNDAAIKELQAIDGIRYVQPNFTFLNYVQFENRTRQTSIGGAPIEVEYNPRFKTFLAGRHLSSGEAREVVITEGIISWLKSSKPGTRRRRTGGGPFQPLPDKTDEERTREASELLGKEITLLTLRGTSPSPTSVFGIPLPGLPADESQKPQTENDNKFDRHVYKIVGVLKSQEGIDFTSFSGASIYIPLEQAKRFREANRDPMSRMGEALVGDTGYQSAEVRVIDVTEVENIKAEIKKRGFNAWSFGTQLDEIKRVFLIINASLALIGGLALLVASFGISNTMIMSIRERTREIGIMKAIGGSDGEIMRIFFVEASLIGLTGGVIGLICGWGIDRVANTLANQWMLRQAGVALKQVEFFSIPWYLSGGAILFAIAVSLVAAIYPALSAARVDPIIALRHD